MKNLYFTLAFVLAMSGVPAQCVIDSAAITSPGIYPVPDSLPCLVSGVPYDQTIQVQCPTSFDSSVSIIFFSQNFTVTIDSMELDSVIGLPSGISWVKNPNRLIGGQNGCLTFNGTASGATGQYNLLWYGTLWGKITTPFPLGARTYTGVLNQTPGFDYYISVINQGDACPPGYLASVKDINLDDAISIFPNPGNGVFELKVKTGTALNGQIDVVDLTGRTVYTQRLDAPAYYQTNIDLRKYAKGLYTLQLRTAQGFASKKLVVE